MKREDLSGIRLEVIESGSQPLIRFAIFLQADGEDFYRLDDEPIVSGRGDSIRIELPETLLKFT